MGTTEAGTKSALTGAMIAGIAGLAWSQWGAAGLSGAASVAARVTGIVVGLVIIVSSARPRQSADQESAPASTASSTERSGSLVSSRAYRLVVALEVVGLLAGTALLNATGHPDYVIAWFATGVGSHFLAFGRLFSARFYWLGAALIASGFAGAIVGFEGGGVGGIKATCGLLAAASLFVSGGHAIESARA
jgi:hypothetical protein